MSLKMNSSPYQRSPRTTLQIMLELTAALLIVWLAAVIYYFTKDAKLGLKAILLMVVALVATAVIDAGVALMRHKKGGNLLKEILDGVIHNYSFVSAIIFTLCCPVYVTYYVIIIGCFASTGIKYCFGGFGKNIFNPAIIARILTGVAFTSAFLIPEEFTGVLNTSVTVTQQYSGLGVKWLSAALPEGFNMGTLLLGNYVGAMGETFTLLILVLGVILAIREVINWRSTAFYLGTVAVTSLVIGFFTKDVNAAKYMMYHLCLGGLMFGAVFMITDPVTSPTSPFGKSLIGVIAGLITVLIRVDGSNPEGVMYSIAIVNIVSPIIDRLITGRTTDGHGKKWATIGGLIAASIVINTAIAVGNVKALDVNTNTNSSEVSGSNSSTSSSAPAELTKEQKLFGYENVKDAQYTEITLGALPQDSHIVKVYTITGKGIPAVLGYEVKGSFEFDAYGTQKIEPTVGVVISLADDKILDVNAIDKVDSVGNKTYADSTYTFIESLIGLNASDVANLYHDLDGNAANGSHNNCTHDAVDFVAGASKSEGLVMNLVAEAASQYVTADKVTYAFGEVENAQAFIMTSNDESIKAAYTYTLNSVNYIGYFVESKTELDIYGMKARPFVAVAINTQDDTVAKIKILASGGTDSSFASKAQTFLDTITNKNINDFIGTTGDSTHTVDNSIGATLSVQKIHDCVVLVCTQYNTNDKANLGGNI